MPNSQRLAVLTPGVKTYAVLAVLTLGSKPTRYSQYSWTAAAEPQAKRRKESEKAEPKRPERYFPDQSHTLSVLFCMAACQVA